MLIVFLLNVVSAAEIYEVSLDPGHTYQTIVGWEATAWAGQEHVHFAAWQNDLLDRVVELGINRVRLEVRSGAENRTDNWSSFQSGDLPYADWRARRYATENDNEDANEIDWDGFHFSELDHTVEQVVLPLKEKLDAQGKKLLINVNYVAFTGQIGSGLRYIHNDINEYAEFVLAVHIHLRDRYGLTPDTWEVILEPDNVSQWDGRLIGLAIVACAEKLLSNGFTPRFVAPSNTNMANAITYFDAMVRVPDVLESLAEFSYHRYGGVSDANLRAIAQRAEQYGVNTAHLEWIGATFQELHKDLKIAQNSAWAQFAMGGPMDSDTGGSYFRVLNPDSGSPRVEMGSRTRYLYQYMHYIQPGSVRIEATGNSSQVDPLAFIRPDGGYVVIINTAQAGAFSISDLPAATYALSYTTALDFNRKLPDVTLTPNQALEAQIPARGILTISAISPVAEVREFQSHE